MTAEQNTSLIDQSVIQDLVQRTASLLDQEDLDAWVALFHAHATYEIAAYSTELRRTTVWWKADRPLLERQLKAIRDHVRDPASRLHVVGPAVVTFENDRASAQSAFALYRTAPGGETSLYMVGRYEDVLVRHSNRWLYVEHKVAVQTRVLEAFTHLPI